MSHEWERDWRQIQDTFLYEEIQNYTNWICKKCGYNIWMRNEDVPNPDRTILRMSYPPMDQTCEEFIITAVLEE